MILNDTFSLLSESAKLKAITTKMNEFTKATTLKDKYIKIINLNGVKRKLFNECFLNIFPQLNRLESNNKILMENIIEILITIKFWLDDNNEQINKFSQNYNHDIIKKLYSLSNGIINQDYKNMVHIVGGNMYKEKYLKYKQKYLSLKNKLY